MEDRSSFLGYTYLADDARFVHLGVDFNVGGGQRVTASLRGQVELVDDDAPEAHGWGLRVVLRARVAPHGWVRLVYAHLERRSVPDRICTDGVVNVGDTIGRVGSSPVNGGWWPHLHVQVVSERAWDELGGRVRDLDGYSRRDAPDLPARFPDPLPILLR